MPAGSVQCTSCWHKFTAMRWILICLVCLCFKSHIIGQDFFSDNIDLVGFSDAAWQVAEKDGNYYIMTISFCDQSPYQCIGLIKLNSSFDLQWKKTYEKVRPDIFTSMAMSDSCIFISGRLLQPVDTLEITVFKIDFDGNLINQWKYGTQKLDISYGITSSFDGGFVLPFNQKNGSNKGITHLIRCNAEGTVIWQKKIATNYSTSIVYSIEKTTDKSYVLGVSGCPEPDCNQREGFALKINDYGDEIFNIVRDISIGVGKDNTYATSTKEHGVVFSRLEDAQPGVWERQVMYKLDSTGNQIWEYHYEAQGYHRLWSLKELQNGDILAVGFNEDHPFIDTTDEYLRYWGGWVIRLSPDGEKKWERIVGDLRYPGDSFGEIFDVVEANDGSLVAVGTIVDTFPNAIPELYNRDVWILHLDSMGCVHPGCTGIFQGITGTSKTIDPSNEALDFSISPNPANNWVILSLSRFTNFNARTITLTDLAGSICIQKTWPLEQSQYLLNTASLPSGAYFLTLKNDNNISTAKKLIIQN